MVNYVDKVINYFWNLFHAQSSLLGDEVLHLLSFGTLGAVATYFGGPGAAVIMGVWRFRDEWEFFIQGEENPNGLRFPIPAWAKTCLDWICQVGPAILVVVIKHSWKIN
jgi:hypothetical protein